MPSKYRTIFLSDVHLGTPSCHAVKLLKFLQGVETENLYLVGDIVDGWRMARRYYFPESHMAVLQHVLSVARSGTNVILLPGNHDEMLHVFSGLCLDKIWIQDQIVHTTRMGHQVMVVHGDKFDRIVSQWRWTTSFLDWMHQVSDSFGSGRWISTNIPTFVTEFRNNAASWARAHRCDTIVVGHKHVPTYKIIHDVLYINTGDWVEHDSVLVEHLDGRLELIFVPD